MDRPVFAWEIVARRGRIWQAGCASGWRVLGRGAISAARVDVAGWPRIEDKGIFIVLGDQNLG